MSPVLALLPSPLLGPAVWRPAAEALSRRGWDVVTTAPAPAGLRSPDDVLRWLLGGLSVDQELVLLPHSNAGLYAPLLAAERQVVANVFVDAGLPPTGGEVPVMPEGLYGVLAQMAEEDGLLPVWTRWFPEADVEGLFPDPAAREEVEREQRRLPLSYFAETLTVPAGWDEVPGAFLAFGETYAADQREAERRGWQVATMDGGHLHCLMSPEQVAGEIHELLGAAGLASG